MKAGVCSDCRSRPEGPEQSADGEVRQQIADGIAVDWSRVAPHLVEEFGGGIPLTTTPEVPRRPTSTIIEIVSAEAAMGMSAFQDVAVAWRDFLGGRSETLQQTMREAREFCLLGLRREALRVGADAVVGIRFDYIEFNPTNRGGMLLLAATGTAVLLE